MKTRIIKKLLPATFAVIFALQSGNAASLMLTNSDIAKPGSGGLWTVGANFAGGVAPGPNDTVLLSNSVPALASVSILANGGPYYFTLKGLAPDGSWTNSIGDGLMPLTSILDTKQIAGLWVMQTNIYNNWWINNQLTEGAHNVYITNKLNIIGSTPRDLLHIASNSVAVGTGFDNTNVIVYATLQGPGSLNVTNPVGAMMVLQGSQNAGSQSIANTASATHSAVLDMSGLNTFSCLLSNIATATDFNTVNSAADPNQTGYARPQGLIFFALTNYITLTDTNFPAYVVGFENNNNGTSFNVSNMLGVVNYLNFDSMLIGGAKINQSGAGAGLYFGSSFVISPASASLFQPAPLNDCYAKFRNIDGVSRQTAWDIGDSSQSLGTTTATFGRVDFTHGGVDALVDTIYLGRGGAPLITSATSTGNLLFGQGTVNASVIDVNQLELGTMLNLVGAAVGNVNVFSNGTLNVNNYIRMINVPLGTTGTPLATTKATLNIAGGNVQVSGSIINNSGAPGGGNSSISLSSGGKLDMQPTIAKPPGSISVATLNLGYGTLTNFSTLNVSNLNVTTPNVGFTLNNGQILSSGGVGFANTLNIGFTNLVAPVIVTNLDGTTLANNGNGIVGLELNGGALLMDIGTSSDKININGGLTLSGVNYVNVNPVAGFGVGTYPIITYNTNTAWVDYNGNTSSGITGNVATQLVAGGPITNSSYVVTFDASTPGVINMIVSISTPTSLTWVGDGSANVWDIVGANNWNNGGGASKFYQFDSATFTDTGSASPAVNLSGVAYPSSVTVNATANYTIGGIGQIAGVASLTKSGTGTLTILTTNSFTGGTAINAGTLRIGNGTTAQGDLSSGAVSVSGTLAVAVPTNQTQNLLNTLSGTGLVKAEGPGKLLLSGFNQSFSGNYIVSGGALLPTSVTNTSFGASASTRLIFATNSGTLDINGLAISNNVTISGSGLNGAGALVNNGAAQAGANMQVFMAGNAAVGGNFRMDLNNVGSTPGGVTGNGFNLTKVGTNCVSIFNSSTNVFTNNIGNITVSSGVLRVQNGSLLTTDPTKTITVAGGATLELNNLWLRAATTNILTLADASCLYGTGGTGTNISGTFTNVQANIYAGTIGLNGTDVFDVSTNSVLRINGVIGGGGNLVKGIGSHPTSATTPVSTGRGTLFLAGANTFTGDLSIQTGTLALTNSGSVATATTITLVAGAAGTLNASGRSDGTLTIGQGQTLRGVGTTVGALVVPTNATIAPGSVTGLITNFGNVTLAGTAAMTITKTNVTLGASQLGSSATLTLGGNLNVTFAGSGLTNGDRFVLFTAPTITGNFTNVNLPTGYTWSNSVATDGAITVLAVGSEPTNAPILSSSLSGSTLTLTWPLVYTSFVLQAQTNNLNIGLSTNWVTVLTSSNAITIPINSANSSVFYRLKK
jgi:autotransporter-associated beta strand protein